MFKQISVLILLSCFTVQTFNGAAIVVNYYTNMATYARNCENKAKPMLHCNGRCQMLKKLKQEANKEKQNPERKSENKNEVLSCRSFFASIQYLSIPNKAAYPIANNSAVTDISAEFFHPPGA